MVVSVIVLVVAVVELEVLVNQDRVQWQAEQVLFGHLQQTHTQVAVALDHMELEVAQVAMVVVEQVTLDRHPQHQVQQIPEAEVAAKVALVSLVLVDPV